MATTTTTITRHPSPITHAHQCQHQRRWQQWKLQPWPLPPNTMLSPVACHLSPTDINPTTNTNGGGMATLQHHADHVITRCPLPTPVVHTIRSTSRCSNRRSFSHYIIDFTPPLSPQFFSSFFF